MWHLPYPINNSSAKGNSKAMFIKLFPKSSGFLFQSNSSQIMFSCIDLNKVNVSAYFSSIRAAPFALYDQPKTLCKTNPLNTPLPGTMTSQDDLQAGKTGR